VLGTEDGGLLLRLADEQDPFVSGEGGAVAGREVILPLPLLERDQ
jgi:hypothetical protein